MSVFSDTPIKQEKRLNPKIKARGPRIAPLTHELEQKESAFDNNQSVVMVTCFCSLTKKTQIV